MNLLNLIVSRQVDQVLEKSARITEIAEETDLPEIDFNLIRDECGKVLISYVSRPDTDDADFHL